MFGLPGGEILDFIESARQAGIRFILTRHEATAAFMADVTGQIQRRPGVCVSTLGPGAVNMTLGVANAYLDRSPLIAITASLAKSAEPYATHQHLDLNAVYRPFTKHTVLLDGHGTEAKVRQAIDESTALRMGPVHIALPSDVARSPSNEPAAIAARDSPRPASRAADADINRVATALSAARRPVLIVGLDVNPKTETSAVRAFVDRMSLPTFVTPKAKGIISEDHAWFSGVCAGVAGDPVIVEFLESADLLVGVGFEPVESDKLWHQTCPLVSVGPVSIAAGGFRPHAEAVGDLAATLASVGECARVRHEWSDDAVPRLRERLDAVLRPAARPRGLSGYELTRALPVVYNDNALSLIDVAQQNRGYPTYGVKYGRVDFAAVAAGLGGWSRRVETMASLEDAVREGLRIDGPVVIDALVDPAEYAAHHPRQPLKGS
jgi:acetolactate synthase-1/2/3 large subunit